MTLDSFYSAARRLISLCLPDPAKTILFSAGFFVMEVFGIDPHVKKTGDQANPRLLQARSHLPAVADPGWLWRITAQSVGKLLQASHFVLLIDDHGLYRPFEAEGYHATPEVFFAQTGRLLRHLEQEESFCPVRSEDGRLALWVWDLPDYERRWLEGLQVQVLVPIKTGNHIRGVICLGPRKSGGVYSSPELHLLGAFLSETCALSEERQRISAIEARGVPSEEFKKDPGEARRVDLLGRSQGD
jgi:hypothetical protein